MGKIYLTEKASNTIRRELKERKVTQEDFAEDHLSVTHRTFQNWLSGKTKIPFDKLDTVQNYFCMSIRDIFGSIPREYEKTTTNLFYLLKTLLQINIKNAGSRRKARGGFNHYAQKLTQQVHIHPYPVKYPFQVIKCETSTKKNYYLNASIILEEDTPLPIDTIFTIGFLHDPMRVRFDYGSIRVKEKLLEVDEVFTSVFAGYRVPLDIEKFKETRSLLKIATWVGEEDITFIIYSTGVNFTVEIEKTTEEETIEATGEKGRVLFRKGVWQ